MPTLRPQIAPFIELTNCINYLEIGFGDGIHFASIPIKNKIIISPECHAAPPAIAYSMPSDQAFKSKEFNHGKFQVAFIDGLHHYQQVIRDINNVLKHLAPNGIMICHDVNPFDIDLEEIDMATTYPRPNKAITWLGDSWKTLFHIKYMRPELGYAIITDFPGFLILWRLSKESIRPVEYKRYTQDDINYPYSFLDINFGLLHKDEFYFGTINEAIEDYKRSGLHE